MIGGQVPTPSELLAAGLASARAVDMRRVSDLLARILADLGARPGECLHEPYRFEIARHVVEEGEAVVPLARRVGRQERTLVVQLLRDAGWEVQDCDNGDLVVRPRLAAWERFPD